MVDSGLVERLRNQASAADELHARSRNMLIEAARDGAVAGLTQREIADALGRSQPEISRLLRFRGRSPLGRTVQQRRGALLTVLHAAGIKNVRVFGSVSRGEDGPASDLDLLVDAPDGLSLFALARLERELSSIVGARVDVVPSRGLRDHIAQAAFVDAAPL